MFPDEFDHVSGRDLPLPALEGYDYDCDSDVDEDEGVIDDASGLAPTIPSAGGDLVATTGNMNHSVTPAESEDLVGTLVSWKPHLRPMTLGRRRF